MCGRYTLAVELDELADRFGCPKVEPVFKARYNVAPTQVMPVVTAPGGNRQLCLMRWGLVPFWAKDLSVGSKLINCRAETAAEKPSFRHSYRRRRCLVPATGYFEWQKNPAGKQPFYIRPADHRVFAMAGLWDEWKDPAGGRLHSYTILTTTATPSTLSIHDRMPYILRREDESGWLQGETPLAPEDRLEVYRVSTLVNSPVHDQPEIIRPL
ncbi:MAG: SOS response-associated peptidase [Syntrophomonas sp.]|nr:SOS response-associated peptidase [Syntrophomonas sp.]